MNIIEGTIVKHNFCWATKKRQACRFFEMTFYNTAQFKNPGYFLNVVFQGPRLWHLLFLVKTLGNKILQR
jgi:hypothetical protein